MVRNDLVLENGGWRNYPELLTDTVWLIPKRDRSGGHALNTYRGNFVPQIPHQMMLRFTKEHDVVADLFCGGGTTVVEGIRLNRRVYACDISPEAVEMTLKSATHELDSGPYAGDENRTYFHLHRGDSASSETLADMQDLLKTCGKTAYQLIFLHPPYMDIIPYSEEGEHPNEAELSTLSDPMAFDCKFRAVARNAFDVLAEDGYICLVIGDVYKNKEVYPLSFYTALSLKTVGYCSEHELLLKAICVKDIQGNEEGKGKDTNLWRYRSLKNGLYVFKHEYIFLYQKVRYEKVRYE